MSPAVTEGIPCCPLLTDNTRTKDKRTATCSVHLFAFWGVGGGCKQTDGRWREKRAEQHKVNKFVFLDAEFSEIRTKRRKKKTPRRKRFLFTLPGYRRSRPASLSHQEKMLIINLRLLATSLFNG